MLAHRASIELARRGDSFGPEARRYFCIDHHRARQRTQAADHALGYPILVLGGGRGGLEFDSFSGELGFEGRVCELPVSVVRPKLANLISHRPHPGFVISPALNYLDRFFGGKEEDSRVSCRIADIDDKIHRPCPAAAPERAAKVCMYAFKGPCRSNDRCTIHFYLVFRQDAHFAGDSDRGCGLRLDPLRAASSLLLRGDGQDVGAIP